MRYTVKFVADSEVQRQTRSYFEIVFEEEAEFTLPPGALLTFARQEDGGCSGRCIECLRDTSERTGKIVQQTLSSCFINT